MVSSVAGECSCQLFRCGDAQVTDDAAMHRVWVVKIDNLSREICAVSRNQLPPLSIRFAIKHLDELKVLIHTGFNLEGVDCAQVRSSEQFVPVSIRCPAIWKIGNQ